MTRVSAILLALLVQAALVTTASAAPAIFSAGDTSPRDYIVAFKSSADSAGETTALERKYGFLSKFRYTAALKGFAARLNPAVAAAVARLPFVEAVELDGVASISADALASGENAPTGIRRMGGATTTTAHAAASVAVAIIDTGIDLGHPDLNAVNGTNCITLGRRRHRRPRPRHPCRGHDRRPQHRQRRRRRRARHPGHRRQGPQLAGHRASGRRSSAASTGSPTTPRRATSRSRT